MKPENRLRNTIQLIGVIAAVIVLASLSRKLELEFLRMKALDALRVCDLLTLFVFAPSIVILGWTLFKTTCIRKSVMLEGSVIIGIFLLGIGFGMHEPANVLNGGAITPKALKESLNFFDNLLGHWIFFAGFMLLTVSLSIAETRDPQERPVPKWVLAFTIISGLAVAAAIYGNMFNEKTGVDIAVLAACLLAMSIFHMINGKASLSRIPITLLLYIAFGLGSLATLLKWLG
ncbi:MAG TPA: hypothetical protein DET40_23255 [Lentisphaeria bacterium]|nr:MAG: hypothetical protein A2X45_24670 [Lentisphaerae bacterium GWF2_50_93]HCE46473.1 hypothetical protein [Lentisphaeria bacterium]